MRQIADRPTGQWFTSIEGPRWWFDSGALALDFAYTGDLAHAEELGAVPERESIHSAEDMSVWLRERFDEFEGGVTDGELVDAISLREAIGSAFLARSRRREPEPGDIDMINLFAATPDIPPVLPGGTRQAGRLTPRVGQTLSELARQAVELLSSERSERIRECASETCGIVFTDESRSNNRRWCSMQRCGNRAKVRAHRAKEKEQP